MASDKLDIAKATAAWRAVELHGDVQKAAAALGMSRTTMQHRYHVALTQFGMEDVRHSPRALAAKGGANLGKLAGVIPPHIPSEDEDLESVLDRMSAERKRQRVAQNARKWMRFTIENRAPFALVFVGDPHGDHCDIDRLRADIATIRDTPRMWGVGLGDYINHWNRKLFHKYAAQSVNERDSLRIARWLFQQPIWLMLIKGNHEGQRWHGSGSPLDWMEHSAPVELQEWQAQFEVTCGGSSWRIWAAHDFPGHSQWNLLHAPNKRATVTGAQADLFICGHRHVFALAQTQHEHTGNAYWVARARGYKPLDDYALEKGYGEQSMGHSIAAVFDPRDGSLTCFADVQRAASYLSWLGGSDEAAEDQRAHSRPGAPAGGSDLHAGPDLPELRRGMARGKSAPAAAVPVPRVRKAQGSPGR